MPLARQFICPFPDGIHARPASALEEFVRKFRSDVSLLNERTQRPADAKSILSVVGADIRHSDSCVFQISGPDEQQAMAEMATFLQETFPLCDAPPKTDKLNGATANGVNGTNGMNGALHLPPCLRNAGATMQRGEVVAPGIARGRGVFAGESLNLAALPRTPDAGPEREWARAEAALRNLVSECTQKLATPGAEAGVEAAFLKVRRSIANDTGFKSLLHREITQRGRSVAAALHAAESHFSAMLDATGNALLGERALDIQDVCRKLARLVYAGTAGAHALEPEITLQSDSVVFAESLTPGQFLALDRKFLKGLVLARASGTSHTVILARSFGVPLLALKKFDRASCEGREVVVDADIGALVTNLTDAARRYYALERRRIEARNTRLLQRASQPAATRDGRRVGIVANIATADEAASAFENGAEGIGLFRTEMLFLDRPAPPDEPEQYAAYRAVLTAAGSRPVVIRTLDAGGDKQLAYLELPPEENPFLGCRAVRVYQRIETLFRAQARALVRASAHGNLRVMIPMIATVDEARWVKSIIAAEQQKCAAEKIPFDPAMKIGAMVEVPSAAFSMDALAGEFDFFSIGSNDLLQYFMAADRMDARLGSLYNPLQPAFLRLLAQIAQAARAAQKEISLCGEIDAQAKILPLLTGLGLDKISAPAPMLAMLKAELAALDSGECRELAARALRCAGADEVSRLLEQTRSRHAPPLLDMELIVTDSDAATKEEAIKQGADRMFVLGRADAPRSVEEAVWLRETQSTTGFGHGFAMAHCKTDAVRADSLVLLKTRAPIDWGSLDGQPVRVMLMLAIRESHGAAAHMKVLARLARKIMDADFRAALEQETSHAQLHALLRQTLSL